MSLLSDPVVPQISVNEARNRLWKKGNLEWKLDKNQEQLYSFIKNNPHKIVVMACSRQMGKSWLLCTLAIEQCIKPVSYTHLDVYKRQGY